MLKIGFVGLSSTGQRLVSYIMRKKGHPVMGYDVSLEQRELFHHMGGVPVEDPKIIFENCNFILLCHASTGVMENWVEEIFDTEREGVTILGFTEGAEDSMKTFQKKAADKNLSLLYAPIPKEYDPAASDEPLKFYGQEKDLKKIRPFLESMGCRSI